MHLAIGHYIIGSSDGVNTVIWRTVNELLQIDPTMKITIFGKAAPEIDKFLPWHNDQLNYCDVPEMSPDFHIPGLEGKSVQIQRVHDYIWHGTNVAEILQEKLYDADVVLMENLSVGINPAATYAFYLWTLKEYQAKTQKRFFVRVHDFAQQRPANFANIKKFQAHLPSDMPDWHQILYPSAPNIEYLAINTNDYFRLMDHGIEPTKIWYTPNCIDNSLLQHQPVRHDAGGLRRQLEEEKGLDPEAAVLFYPVRAIPRKNVEEAIYLLQMLNNLVQDLEYRQKYHLERRFHLVVSLGGKSLEEKQYCTRLQEFIRQHHLPVTIDISDLVGLHREYDPENPDHIIKYGVADMYHISSMTVSTSVLEGFGFVFIEPWLMGHGVIGRNIPSVTMDFTKAGLSLDHLYNVLLINGIDFADLGAEDPDGGLNKRLLEVEKIDHPEYLRMILQKNSAPLKATLRMFRPERRRSAPRNIIIANRKKVFANYSSPVVVGKLYRILNKQEPTYLLPIHGQRQEQGLSILNGARVTA
ncbi:MAG: hypothetical protein AMJ79_14810 [Phycisphaerae bacterium SM23_30]|nr:MAG: hypothetical protein AMJ79_14810 [Phycisphaerae bacterium SM23_30]